MSGLHFGVISDKCIFTHSDKQQGCHAVDLMMMCLSICMELFLGQFKKGHVILTHFIILNSYR